MMIALLVAAQFVFGTISWAPDPVAIKALQERGLSTRIDDFPAAIDFAFALQDKGLALAMLKDMEFSERKDRFADQVIRLYEALPDDDFKEAITLPVACALKSVDRVSQSRWTCEFYSHAVRVLYGSSSFDARKDAVHFLEGLASHCGLSVSPHLVKSLLTVPEEQALFGDIFLKDLVDEHWSAAKPGMAYHLLQRYEHRRGRISSETLYAPIRERAKPLLSANELPPGSSLKDVLKQLDAMIEAEGKKLCDKYGKLPYIPAPPAPAPVAPPQ